MNETDARDRQHRQRGRLTGACIALAVMCAAKGELVRQLNITYVGSPRVHIICCTVLAGTLFVLCWTGFTVHRKLSVGMLAFVGFAAVACGGPACGVQCAFGCQHPDSGIFVALLGAAIVTVCVVEDRNLILKRQRKKNRRQ